MRCRDGTTEKNKHYMNLKNTYEAAMSHLRGVAYNYYCAFSFIIIISY